MARQMKAEREKRAVILEAEGIAPVRDPARRGREAVGDPAGRRPPRSRLPRSRGARARRPGRSQGDQGRSATRSKAAARQAINYFIAQKYVEAVGKFATLAQRQDDPVPGRGDPADRHARRHRRAGQGSLRRRRQRRRLPPAEGRAGRARSRRVSGLPLEPGWLWLIGGVVLLIAEVIAPGFFLVFIGAAAIATGLLTLALRPRCSVLQLGAFRRLRAARRRIVGRRFYASRYGPAADPAAQRRAARGCIGKIVTWSTPSTSMAAGCAWATASGARAADRAAPGERVRIIGVEGNCLKVEPEHVTSANRTETSLIMISLNRREALAGLAAAGAMPLLSSRRRWQRRQRKREAKALLNSIAENLLRLNPESATSLGIDTGARAELALSSSAIARRPARQRLPRRSRRSRARPRRSTRPRSASRRAPASRSCGAPTAPALEGFALPYGDIAVGGWRNTPYVVIQNVGAYLDIPQLPRQRSSDRERAPTPRPISRGCSRIARSSTASSAGCRRRAPTGSCRRRS